MMKIIKYLLFPFFLISSFQLKADVSNENNYTLFEIPMLIREEGWGWQPLVYSGSQIGTTEFFIFSASHGNTPCSQMDKIYNHEVRGAGWQKVVTAGNDDKSCEMWIRQVTSANVNETGEFTGGWANHGAILVYDGLAEVTDNAAVTQCSTTDIAINNNGNGPYLVVAASDNNTSLSGNEMDHFAPGDDVMIVYLTNVKNFSDSAAGNLRGAIASISLVDSGPVLEQPNNAEFVSQNVPSFMNPGETQEVSITLKNTGSDAWSSSNGQSLGTQNPQGNTTWTGSNRVSLAGTIASGSTHTFTFNITAPITPGSYDFQWQMVDDSGSNVGWFGDKSGSVSIGVGLVSLDIAVTDDMEEQVSTGNVSGSSDLEFIHADEGDPDRGDQVIGLRFQNVSIPKGVQISNAYIQFTGDAANAGSGSAITLSIAGHDNDNSGAFLTGDTSDVSSRVTTSSTVNWNPPAWGSGASGVAERSPDISNIIQEIIDRNGWNSGNDLSLIISGTQGLTVPARRAESAEGVAGKAPMLHIEYGEADVINTNYPHFDFGSYTSSYGITMPYRIYIPEAYNPSQNYPIVLAIHGLGRRGSDNEMQLDVMITEEWSSAAIQSVSQCFIVAPQLPLGEVWVTPESGGYNGSYTRDANTTTDYLRTAWEILDDVISQYSIDLNRQYIAGHSSGGYATWDTLYHFPDRFAAALASAGGADPSTAPGYINIPIWAVHGSVDTTVPPTGSSDMINAIRAAGGSEDLHRLTIYNGVGHEAQVPAMSDINIPTWILSQSKSGSSGPSVNLIKNGSFEVGGSSPTDWTLGSTASGSTVTAQNGSTALRLDGSSSPTRQTIAIEANADYNISVWVQNAGVTSGKVVFDTNDVFDAAGQGQFVVNAGVASTWTQYSGTFNSGAETAVTIRMFGSSMVGIAYFDNVSLVKLGESLPENNAPVFTSSGITTAEEDSLYIYSVVATDSDGDALTFSAPVLPNWLSFDIGTAVLSGVPSLADIGSHPVSIQVSDGTEVVVQDFTINVTAKPNPYEEWKLINNVTSDTADDDGDGISNIMEFALGGDPRTSDAEGKSPEVNLNGSDIEFRLNREQATVTYTVQKSSDLINWEDHIIVTDIHGAVGENATVQVSVSEMNSGKLFLRLKVEK